MKGVLGVNVIEAFEFLVRFAIVSSPLLFLDAKRDLTCPFVRFEHSLHGKHKLAERRQVCATSCRHRVVSGSEPLLTCSSSSPWGKS